MNKATDTLPKYILVVRYDCFYNKKLCHRHEETQDMNGIHTRADARAYIEAYKKTLLNSETFPTVDGKGFVRFFKSPDRRYDTVSYKLVDITHEDDREDQTISTQTYVKLMAEVVQ